jgi:multicomponent Na+:H+ antiporter subunit F
MIAVYLGAGFVILLASAVGLVVVRPRSMADRMLAVQLIGSSVVAVSLLLSVATANPALLDVALMAALLAAFSACALRLATVVPSRPPE